MPNDNLIHLIYVSAQISKNPLGDLLQIEKISSEKNSAVLITGLLLYKDETFMQLVEGPEQAIKELFNIIKGDSRHRNIVKILEEPITERSFGEWSMAVKEIPKDFSLPHGIKKFTDPVLAKIDDGSSNLIAIDILNGFKNDLAIASNA